MWVYIVQSVNAFREDLLVAAYPNRGEAVAHKEAIEAASTSAGGSSLVIAKVQFLDYHNPDDPWMIGAEQQET